MIRAITIFTIALAFIGLGGGFLFGAANFVEAFPESVVAPGVSGRNDTQTSDIYLKYLKFHVKY